MIVNVTEEVFTQELWNFLWERRASEMDVLKALVMYRPWYQRCVELEIKRRKEFGEVVNKFRSSIKATVESTFRSADKTCPECGGKEFQPTGGCNVCVSCGFSECG